MSEFLIITGLSGAGRSTVGGSLEDLGWFVIDNMPIELIAKVAELVSAPGATNDRVALVIGRDVDQLEQLEGAIRQLRAGGSLVRVLFLEASDESLVRRFGSNRRRHPLGLPGVMDAIATERERLEPIKGLADVIVDSTELNVNQLRDRVGELFGSRSPEAMQVSVVSFGFKHGMPIDADCVLDCRFLPNPHWVSDLRPLTGLDQPVRAYVLERPEAAEFVERVDDLLSFLLPAYIREGKAYLTVAIGCTGGRHRSVVMVEELARRIQAQGFRPGIQHRDIARGEG